MASPVGPEPFTTYTRPSPIRFTTMSATFRDGSPTDGQLPGPRTAGSRHRRRLPTATAEAQPCSLPARLPLLRGFGPTRTVRSVVAIRLPQGDYRPVAIIPSQSGQSARRRLSDDERARLRETLVRELATAWDDARARDQSPSDLHAAFEQRIDSLRSAGSVVRTVGEDVDHLAQDALELDGIG
jgi:hypothetical protein